MFPYKDEMDFKSVVPDNDMINGYLLSDWGNMLSLTEADPVGLPKHLPKEMDQVAHRQCVLQRAIQWECPIQMDVSTSSYVDAKKRQVTHPRPPIPTPEPYPNPIPTLGS